MHVPNKETHSPRSAPRSSLAGFLVIDKPLGMSSFGVVARVRRRADRAKTGHAGTLDPLATGVLVLAIGSATRAISRMVETTKQYRTEIDLSAFTSTDDREGERTEVRVSEPPTHEVVLATVARFQGVIEQRPPAFSAMKIAGKRAYQLARDGATPEMVARPVRIDSIRVVRYDWPTLEIEIVCGKGTYVRSIARDVGHALGTGGHCASLCRTAVGPFTLAQARQLDALPDHLQQGDLLATEDALRLLSQSPANPG